MNYELIIKIKKKFLVLLITQGTTHQISLMAIAGESYHFGMDPDFGVEPKKPSYLLLDYHIFL